MKADPDPDLDCDYFQNFMGISLSKNTSGDAIWWVLARWKPTWSDVGNTLAPSVSGSLRAKPGCGCPAWQSCHWLLSCVAA